MSSLATSIWKEPGYECRVTKVLGGDGSDTGRYLLCLTDDRGNILGFHEGTDGAGRTGVIVGAEFVESVIAGEEGKQAQKTTRRKKR
jgi:hypothetical protein